MGMHLKTPTPDLDRSLDHWRRAGFVPTGAGEGLITDGQVVIHVDTHRSVRPGVVLTRDSWDDVLGPLEAFGPVHAAPDGARMVPGPSGTWVYLVEGAAPEARAEGAEPLLGNFVGISLETPRIADSRRFWETLGFAKAQGDEAHGWISLEGPDGGVSLMKPFLCPHLFFNPGLTYFNGGRNPEILPELRRRGVEFAEEITAFNERGEVDNVILRDPGGLGVFVFND